MSADSESMAETWQIPVLGTVNVDANKGTIDLGNGCTLGDIPLVGKGSIILDPPDEHGCCCINYEAMRLRDAAIDAALN